MTWDAPTAMAHCPVIDPDGNAKEDCWEASFGRS